MDVQQRFVLYQPSYPLSEYVECLWHVYGPAPYRRDKILPTHNIELIINLGEPPRAFQAGEPQEAIDCTTAWVCGLQTQYIITETPAFSNMFGVRFKAGGAYPFFHFPMGEVTDLIVDMQQVWGAFVEELRERLFEAADTQARFLLLERMLLERLSEERNNISLVSAANRALLTVFKPATIREISDDLGVSHKHLISRFKTAVGTSPKMLQRVYRFHRALYSIDPSQNVDWAEIAYAHYYYDQAHFNRDFAHFTGSTPTDYMTQRRAFLGDDLKQGEDVIFVPIE